nr:MAG TPA: anaerobic ribonucleoside-triphosphate reductase activating protein [Caudoviricetes sp.]
MLKYVDTKVVFRELPDEITLAINLSGCPCHCEGCHSPYLAGDVGTELDYAALEKLIKSNTGITAICFMGGDGDPKAVYDLACMIRDSFLDIKIGWYSGRPKLPGWFYPLRKESVVFDYVKLGPYIPKCGGLDKATTNQRLYRITLNDMGCYDVKDVTNLLRKTECIM